MANQIIAAHENLGLDIAIEFMLSQVDKKYYCAGDQGTPLEESVFDYVRNKGRLIDFGERTVVNYPNLSIIVRNMPVGDSSLHGRIRDHIALIAQGADAKVVSLKAELALKEQRKALIKIINQIEESVSGIDRDYRQQQTMSEDILSSVGQTIEESFMQLGLTEQQEEFQRSIILLAEEKTKHLYTAGLELDEKFSSILTQIQETLELSLVEDDEPEEEETIDAVALF